MLTTIWARLLLQFYSDLKPPENLPGNISWLYPQQHPEVQGLMATFFQKFYNDTTPRRLLLGINPGRFGAGVTGINFTAQRQLVQDCGIPCSLPLQSELSAEFIYAMINAWGGPRAFYSQFFIGAVCPLGFVQAGKNINYYDDRQLFEQVRPFIMDNMERLTNLPFQLDRVYCIGGEKNFKHLAALNKKGKWFGEIIPLPHPRFVMQYRRKKLQEYVDVYLHALEV